MTPSPAGRLDTLGRPEDGSMSSRNTLSPEMTTEDVLCSEPVATCSGCPPAAVPSPPPPLHAAAPTALSAPIKSTSPARPSRWCSRSRLDRAEEAAAWLRTAEADPHPRVGGGAAPAAIRCAAVGCIALGLFHMRRVAVLHFACSVSRPVAWMLVVRQRSSGHARQHAARGTGSAAGPAWRTTATKQPRRPPPPIHLSGEGSHRRWWQAGPRR
jgi:hypothetical protein